jgi:hypothetical protein
MPPRYAYWTIIAGGLPTAFRAADRDELMPTFQRIKEKHPDAVMKWFARGKLWESQEAARAVDRRGGDRNRHGGDRNRHDGDRNRHDGDRNRHDGDREPRAGRPADHRGPPADRKGGPSGPPTGRPDDRRGGPSGPPKEARGRAWRPGGEHRDPRQKFIDAKKDRNTRIRKERWEHRNASPHKPPRKPWVRAQGTEEPDQPPRPRGPNREPPPKETPEPTPPPRPDQEVTPPPGPPERGQRPQQRRFRPRPNFRKGPRR